MSEADAVEQVARAFAPLIWKDELPIPTRADTLTFHARRQRSIKQARAAMEAGVLAYNLTGISARFAPATAEEHVALILQAAIIAALSPTINILPALKGEDFRKV